MRKLRPTEGKEDLPASLPTSISTRTCKGASLGHGASVLPHCQSHSFAAARPCRRSCQRVSTRNVSPFLKYVVDQQAGPSRAQWCSLLGAQHTVTQKHMWWAITVINFMRLCVPNVRFQADLFVELCQASAWFNQVVLNLPLFTLGESESRTMSLSSLLN